MLQNFHEITENHMNVNFCDKNFMIATFFRDYRRPHADNSCCHSGHDSYTRGVGYLFNAVVVGFNTRRRKLNCLDGVPCRFGRQFLLVF